LAAASITNTRGISTSLVSTTQSGHRAGLDSHPACISHYRVNAFVGFSLPMWREDPGSVMSALSPFAHSFHTTDFLRPWWSTSTSTRENLLAAYLAVACSPRLSNTCRLETLQILQRYDFERTGAVPEPVMAMLSQEKSPSRAKTGCAWALDRR
jgi:hypothetical protein